MRAQHAQCPVEHHLPSPGPSGCPVVLEPAGTPVRHNPVPRPRSPQPNLPDAARAPSPSARGTAWLARLAGRLVARRVRTKGLDLSRLSFLPRGARIPLQRVGVDPVPELGRLRATRPVHRMDLPFDLDVHLVTGHLPARALLSARDGFSNDIRHLFGGDGPASAEDVGGLGFTDQPEHTRLRALVAPHFTRRRIQQLRPAVEDVVARRLDALAAAGSPADLARHLSFPVPLQTICDVLGLDAPDQDALVRLGTQRFDATGGAAGAFGAVSAQRRFLLDVVTAQRADPGSGLIGRILREQGDAVSDTELAGLADGILTGGYETTAAMISLGTMVLLRDPAHAALVRDGSPQEVERAVEELLRYLTVVQVSFPRFATRDTDLLGQPVEAGAAVLVSLSAANRDPASAGPRAEEFDPTRTPVDGHLAFGHGFHRCVGAELARLELSVVLPALLRRFPDLALAVPEERLRFRTLSFVYGVDELPVRF